MKWIIYVCFPLPAKQASEQLWMLDSFSLIRDDYLLSYVVEEKDDLSSWNLAININSNITYQDSISTHIHEFAHLLFLSSRQVRGTPNMFSCDGQVYVEDKGCVYAESYTQAFVNKFGNHYNQEFDEELVMLRAELLSHIATYMYRVIYLD